MDGYQGDFGLRQMGHGDMDAYSYRVAPVPALAPPVGVAPGSRNAPLEEDAEPLYHEIVALARLLTGAQAAAFAVLDHERVWLRARVGGDMCSLLSSAAISSYATERDGLLEISDTHAIPALAEHPLVRGDDAGMPALRSYAAVPLYSAPPERVYIGTLSVFGATAHSLSDEACAGLVDLGRHLQNHLHARESTRRDPHTGFYHADVMAELVERAVTRACRDGGSLSLIGVLPARPITAPGMLAQYAGRVSSVLVGHGELAGHVLVNRPPAEAIDGLLLLLPETAQVHASIIADELREALSAPGLRDDTGHPAHFGLGVTGQTWTGSAGPLSVDMDAAGVGLASALTATALALAGVELGSTRRV